jgi:hypothetical protein
MNAPSTDSGSCGGEILHPRASTFSLLRLLEKIFLNNPPLPQNSRTRTRQPRFPNLSPFLPSSSLFLLIDSLISSRHTNTLPSPPLPTTPIPPALIPRRTSFRATQPIPHPHNPNPTQTASHTSHKPQPPFLKKQKRHSNPSLKAISSHIQA